MPPGITYGHRRAGPHGEPTTVDYATSPVGEAYQQKSCQDTHKSVRAGHSTDLDLLATACAAAAERAAGIEPGADEPAVDPATGELR
jgi:hypothetical protein